MNKNSAPLCFLLAAAWLSSAPLASAQPVDTGGIARNFTLKNRVTGLPVSLYDYAGKIVVLDFFAYWCPPCQLSSPELEQNVQRYYAARGGNPSGIPVQVIEVNIETANPALTDQFVSQVGADLALDDLQWVAYNQFLVGQNAIPRFVIINGAANSTTHRPWQVVKNTLGWGGTNNSASFRQSIDSVLAPPPAPPITTQPQSQHVNLGASATFTLAATGTGLSYQWKKDGNAIAGATGASYTVTRASADHMGFYSVVVSAAGGSVESSIATLTVATGATSRLSNVSTRGFVPAGGDLTSGFVIRGPAPKSLLVRAVGPGLNPFGVPGVLADPKLDLIPLGGSTVLQANDNWTAASSDQSEAMTTACQSVGAFALPANSRDAAALASFNPQLSTGYTVRITSSAAGGTGIALAEVYDRDAPNAGSRLVNVSTNGFVGNGPQALVPGFVIEGTEPKQLLIRAVGSGLTQFGVSGVLADPQLSVIPLGKTFAVVSNDNWSANSSDQLGALTAAFQSAGAFALPAISKDAAVVVRLPPGGYTVMVSGVGDTTGRALVEVFDMDP